MITIISTILIFGSIGFLGLIISKYILIPYSLILVLLGFLLSLLTEPLHWDTGIRAYNFQDLMLFALLPILIFEAAYSLNTKQLLTFLPNILTLATIGVVISSTVIAAFLYLGINHVGFPFIAAILAGVVVSATDPVAVVSQLKELKAPEDLNVLIEGESLFNDATAIVIFSIVLSVALGISQPSISDVLITFVRVFVGGVLVGALAGFIAAKLVCYINAENASLMLLTLLLAYGSFYIAEHLFHVSGIVAVLIAALIFKCYTPESFTQYKKTIHTVWQSFGFIANVFVFVLLGLVVSLDMFTQMWFAIGLAIIGSIIARTIAVYASNGLNAITFGQAVNIKYAPIMIWGGLKGAVTIALVLSLPTQLPYWWTVQSIAFGVVIFSLAIQATTTPLLMKKMNL
jgi:CPA1 family monovalent cation:H+ antiporter